MLDFIFAVDDTKEWHRINLKQNYKHYSGLRFCGLSAIEKVQKCGSHIYFNPHIKINDYEMKYGLISCQDLIKDLSEWDTLYASGRMHKPINIITSDDEIMHYQHKNLNAALHTALLQLPKEFSERELFLKIAGLSYTGDVRMKFAENPHKVSNIVSGQHRMFREIYEPLIDKSTVVKYMRGAYLEQDVSLEGRKNIVSKLPVNLVRILSQELGLQVTADWKSDQFNHELTHAIIQNREMPATLRHTLRTLISKTSLSQTAKGLLTGGILRSSKYALRKIRKRYFQ